MINERYYIITRTGILNKKIPCHMLGRACKCRIVKKS